MPIAAPVDKAHHQHQKGRPDYRARPGLPVWYGLHQTSDPSNRAAEAIFGRDCAEDGKITRVEHGTWCKLLRAVGRIINFAQRGPDADA
jgi:hypothetical protein